jgi:proline dehydrogenase
MARRRQKQSSVTKPLLVATLLLIFILYRLSDRWLRALLIYLSHAAWAKQLAHNLSISHRVARRFVAGETMDDAIYIARKLNSQKMMVTLDYLGESVTDEAVATTACNEILSLLDRIYEENVDANVSVKLSQLGLRISYDLALENIRQIVNRACQFSNKIRIDMEESDLVDTTLDVYRTLRDKDGFDNVGVVIQSYLLRSKDDVEQLIREGAWVRLCKGAYAEPPHVAFTRKSDTDDSYIRLMRRLLSEEALNNGTYLGIATHDERIIQIAIDFAADNGISPNLYEFQMLYGIRRELQSWLVSQGYLVRIYVPYGIAWYPYLIRRLAERPANLWFFVSNLIRH